MLPEWVLTVFSARKSLDAISGLVSPSAMSCKYFEFAFAQWLNQVRLGGLDVLDESACSGSGTGNAANNR